MLVDLLRVGYKLSRQVPECTAKCTENIKTALDGNNLIDQLEKKLIAMQLSAALQQQYIDSVLQSLHDQMIDTGLNNITLPDTTTNFSKRRLGVNWQGEAVLYNGNLKGLESLHRTGETQLAFNRDGVKMDVEVGINDPLVNYDVHATFMNHGPRGTVTGTLSHITCDMKFRFQPSSDTVTLEKLTVKEIGNLKAKVTGLGRVLNFIVSHILQVAGNRVKWKVSTMMEGVVKDMLNEIIAKTPLPTLPTPSVSVGGIDLKSILA